MSELYDSYRLYFMLERKNERNNQFQHTSHLLSESVLTAACPVYYTCKYYNAYVAFCREPPRPFKPKRDLLQFRNKKPLTSVTFGGNI